jgi:hypothetical protein
VWEKENPLNLRRAEDGLSAKHAELHPIVAVMIEGLNKLNNHKVSRSTALKDSSSVRICSAPCCSLSLCCSPVFLFDRMTGLMSLHKYPSLVTFSYVVNDCNDN